MGNRAPMGPGEHYHIYNRGVDKRRVFLDKQDYERFLALLYLCNSNNPVRFNELQASYGLALNDLLQAERASTITNIRAYVLMPNHFHLLLYEKTEGGISAFMQKVLTGYTTYFNNKYGRNGPLFAGVFKSKHVFNDTYFKRAWSYIHLNPVELVERKWKEGTGDIERITDRLKTYKYSSLPDFYSISRPHRNIIDSSTEILFDKIPPVGQMVADAQAYYQQLDKSFKV